MEGKNTVMHAKKKKYREEQRLCSFNHQILHLLMLIRSLLGDKHA